MNFIKRAFLSVQARKGKSLILFTVFVVVTNLVLAGFAIQNVSKTANDLARKKLGVDVTLGLDGDKFQQYALKQREERPNERIQRPEISTEEADKLAKSSYVKDFNYIKNDMGLADGYTPINNDKEGNAMIGSVDGSQRKMPNTSIEGVRTSDLLKEFKEGTYKVSKGRPITAEDKNKKVALVEEQLAEHNNLQVGDKLKIKTSDEISVIELEIIGIYKRSDVNSIEETAPPMMHLSNKVYVSYESLKGFSENEDMKGTPIDQAIYYLKDPDHIDAFKAEGKKTGIDFDLFKLDAHDALYQKMVGPIENIASTSKWIVYLVSITGSIILGLIIMLTIKERRRELGILLAIGEKKGKLIGQLLVEVLCIAVLAFGISIFTGGTVSQKMGDSLLQKEVTSSEERQQQEANNRGGSIAMFGMNNDQDQDVDPIDNIDVSVTSQDVLNLGGLGLGIAILSTILPALSILRLNPKEILLKDE
ncbi:ABC transporter permease [Bacillus sp. DX1.1]|uniref:ABC transporter permease n=1 Tax=unclassified Bacillus (in: firmicutes) TaxID=185979 RepID=UPI0025706721|nr:MULTISPECIES: ABC transporter permease [unclassified Bacillus (in: firmicutes)]MDM5155302.1 ABC transporter permease [Bacillus sp. DX1.1]WJE79620.1 ABC transporter permease [Bacillus sp. DX3.1]